MTDHEEKRKGEKEMRTGMEGSSEESEEIEGGVLKTDKGGREGLPMEENLGKKNV